MTILFRDLLTFSSSLFFLLFLFCLPPLLPLQSTRELSHEELSTKNRTKLRAEKQWRTSQCRRRAGSGSTSGSPSNHCALHSMPKRLHYGRNHKILSKYYLRPFCIASTGKSLSEALILASTNPKYDGKFST